MKTELVGLIALIFLGLVFVSAAYYAISNMEGFTGLVNENGNVVMGETNSRGTFTLYYADWCPHCQTIKPIFKDFMGDGTVKVNGQNITVKMKEEKNIKKGVDPEVQGYPTLLYSDSAGKIVEFNGPRTPDGFMEFLKTKILS
jgi:thiol-disulfide isomerase/thioredoxin